MVNQASARETRNMTDPSTPQQPSCLDEQLKSRVADALLAQTEVLVIVLDRKGNPILFNPACERLSGYTLDDFSTRPFWDVLLPEDDVDAVRKIYEDSNADRYPNQKVTNWITKSGSQAVIAWSHSVILDGDGGIELRIGMGVDITERFRAAERVANSEAQLESLRRSAGDAIVGGSSDGNINSWNRAAAHLFGYAQEEVIGRPITMLIPDSLRNRHLNAFGSLLSGNAAQITPKPIEVSALHKDGREFPVQLSLGCWASGDGLSLVAIMRDLSDAKAAEARQAELQAQLEKTLTKVIAGFIPICSHCKSIRDEGDNWAPLEEFIHERSDVTLSHGICPSCLKAHYQDWAED